MSRKFGLRIAGAIGLVAVLCVAGWYGFLAWSRTKVRAEVDAVFAGIRDTGAKASFTEASFDPREMGVTVTGISILSPDGSARLKVDRLSARGGERPHDRRVAVDALDLDGVEIALTGEAAAGGTITYTLPQVMIDRYNGPMTLIAAGEGNGPFGALRVALRQLASTTAAKVTIPEAHGRIAPAGAAPAEIAYRNLAAEGINAGIIRSLLVDSITFAFTPPPEPAPAGAAQGQTAPVKAAPGRVTAQVDGFVAAQIDTAPLLLMTQPGGPSGKAAETYGRIYGKVVTGPYKVTQENGPSHGAQSVLLENVAIRPASFDAQRVAALDALSRKAPNLSLEDSRRLAELSRDLVGGIAFTTVAISNATTEQQGEKGKVATARLEGLANGVLDGATFEGVEGVTPGGGAAKMARLAVRQLDFNQLARLSAEADAPSPLSALVLFKVLSGVELKGLEVPYGEGQQSNEPVKVGTFALSWGGSLGALPSYFDFTLADVSGPITADDGEPFTYLVQAGITRATISMGLKAAYDINDRTLTIAPVTTEVKDAFRVNLESALVDVPDAAFTDAAGFLAALPVVTAGPVKVTLTDLGLARLMFAQLAAAAGVSEDAYRNEVVALAEGFADELKTVSPDAASVGAAVVAFLRKPGTLTVTATPKGRVPLLALAGSDDPSVVLEAFSFSATATAP
ncbi:hypothetical protein [Xanthobacter oligotrophicus]|uniref:hypothetical protein n=1 Tax=Xanthobacter oligotrophicus TaxID=2607286 RepID=UPI0011F1C3A9|nr:hypothetical protein [Xanthobacter oligotrophicus]MCG5235999.1 hypothetical protein [Xanthobacter oligotrophicus]